MTDILFSVINFELDSVLPQHKVILFNGKTRRKPQAVLYSYQGYLFSFFGAD